MSVGNEHERDSEEGQDFDLVTGENPAEHVELLPSKDVQPSSHDAVSTAAATVGRQQLPAKLAEAMVNTADVVAAMELDGIDESRFRANRPQADFVRLPWPLATRDPEVTGQAIWWYAAGIGSDDKLYLEGVRGPDIKALAMALSYKPRQVRARDLVEEVPENEPQPAAEKGQRSARAAGLNPTAAKPQRQVAKAIPDDCSIVFRHMVDGEVIGTWKVADVAKYVLMEMWGLHSHPDYIKMKQGAQGWKETKAEGLYPTGGGLYG